MENKLISVLGIFDSLSNLEAAINNLETNVTDYSNICREIQSKVNSVKAYDNQIVNKIYIPGTEYNDFRSTYRVTRVSLEIATELEAIDNLVLNNLEDLTDDITSLKNEVVNANLIAQTKERAIKELNGFLESADQQTREDIVNEIAKYNAADEYTAQKITAGNGQGISEENKKWWLDAPLVASYDEKTGSILFSQEDENGNMVGMSWVSAANVGFVVKDSYEKKERRENLQNYVSAVSNSDAIKATKDNEKEIGFRDINGNKKDGAINYSSDSNGYTINYKASENSEGKTTETFTINPDGSQNYSIHYDSNNNSYGRTEQTVTVNADGSENYSIHYDSNSNNNSYGKTEQTGTVNPDGSQNYSIHYDSNSNSNIDGRTEKTGTINPDGSENYSIHYDSNSNSNSDGRTEQTGTVNADGSQNYSIHYDSNSNNNSDGRTEQTGTINPDGSKEETIKFDTYVRTDGLMEVHSNYDANATLQSSVSMSRVGKGNSTTYINKDQNGDIVSAQLSTGEVLNYNDYDIQTANLNSLNSHFPSNTLTDNDILVLNEMNKQLEKDSGNGNDFDTTIPKPPGN